MDAATIGARVGRGLGRAAAVLGTPYSVYRPVDVMAPLAEAALVGSIAARLDRDAKLVLRAPAGYGAAARFLLGDAGTLLAGDYLVGEDGTFFVAAITAGAPALCVACNRVLTLRATMSVAPGGVTVSGAGYGGVADAVVAAGWPASVLLDGHGPGGVGRLPGDGRGAGWMVLLPPLPGVLPGYGMVAVDEDGRRLLLEGVELSRLGARITAGYAGS